MKHADFAIGTEFETCTGQRWRCTDIGRRSIVAIELESELAPEWFNGRPYPVPEVVFDELDIARVFRSRDEATQDALALVDRGAHPGYSHAVVTTMMEARYPDASRRYPHPRLLRIDRIDAAGEILHPYAADPTCDGWRILLYAPFTETFSVLPEAEFVRLRPASPEDYDARKCTREDVPPVEPLRPNGKTIVAMEEARRGGMASFESVEDLMTDLNAQNQPRRT